MSLTSRSTAVLLASAVVGLAAVGHAADDWEAPVVSAVSTEPDCDKPPSDEPRDEQMVIEELITELQCMAPPETAELSGNCLPPRCCATDPD